jgi:hypothetical protein
MGWVANATLRPPYPPYLLYRRLEESRAGPNNFGEHKITRPYRGSNFDLQPVVIRYIDWAILAWHPSVCNMNLLIYYTNITLLLLLLLLLLLHNYYYYYYYYYYTTTIIITTYYNNTNTTITTTTLTYLLTYLLHGEQSPS